MIAAGVSYWFVDRALPGLLDSVPGLALAGAGLWLSWHKVVRPHIDRKVTEVADAQMQDIQGITNTQTAALSTELAQQLAPPPEHE